MAKGGNKGQCKRCQSTIVWQCISDRWIPYNLDGALHRPTCAVINKCRYCQAPVLWREHEGKPRCFDPNGIVLHNVTCTNKDCCSHCHQKVKWKLVEGKWIAFDEIVPKFIHWSVCPKNPEAAREIIDQVTALKEQVKKLEAEIQRLEGIIRYKDVELSRLTRAKFPVEKSFQSP